MVNNIEAKDHPQYSDAKIDVSLLKMAYFYLRTVAIFHQPVFFLLLILLDQVYLSFFSEVLNFLCQEMRVLVLLSNCNHVKSMIIPNVLKQCDKYGFEEIKGVQEVWIKDWKCVVWISRVSKFFLK